MDTRTQDNKRQSLFSFLLLSLLCLTALNSQAADPVRDVQLFAKQTHVSHLPRIVVTHNGVRYNRLVTSRISMPVEVSASCSGNTTLSKALVGIGRFNIFSGHFGSEQKYYYENLRIPPNRKQLPRLKHVFQFSLARNRTITNVDPVKACNDFMRSKMSQGIKKAWFMKKNRGISMRYEISFAAECRRKWKAEGFWKQTTKTVQAIIICKGR